MGRGVVRVRQRTIYIEGMMARAYVVMTTDRLRISEPDFKWYGSAIQLKWNQEVQFRICGAESVTTAIYNRIEYTYICSYRKLSLKEFNF